MTAQKATDHVRRTLFFTALIVVAEPLSATILLPFVVFMVRSFQQTEEKNVGFWCGVITSSFFIPQMLTAPIYGHVSDRYGRKPTMVFGLLGAAFFMTMFGLSHNLAWAIISRALCGLFNGNAGVSRTSVGELAHNAGLNQGKAFGLFGLCTALGTLVGPLIGGFLSMPAEKYGIEGPFDIFTRYPFLLPSSISTLYNLVVVIASTIFLPETNIHSMKQHEEQQTSHVSPDDNKPADEESATPSSDEETPLLPEQHPHPQSSSANGDQKQETSRVISKGLLLLITGQGIIALHAIIFDEMYPVIASTETPIGLGFTSNEIARSLLVLGPVVLTVQLICYPQLTKLLSYTALWRTSSVLFLCVYAFFPLLTRLENESVSQWACLYLLLGFRIAAVVVGYTSVAVLLIGMSPPTKRGFLVGLAQMAISASRAIGPTVGGALWSWGLSNGMKAPLNQDLLYVFQVVLATMQFVSSFGLKEPAM